MYLSKLELHGFKSFAAPTVLQFDPGVTAIVGPNGCGKSNVVDAVRWVVGEQRARILRSEKMENVIFNGTSKRRPLGMAEVQLTIENTRGVLPTEYSEVTLGRRLYRSGESEYLLNGVPCRLKDIVDLFMDTGMGAGAYSVIELKMVEELLSDNAQDRRHLFEEAAGITKYKLRRRQALDKLGATQVDLNRLRDLTDEIDKRVQSLRRQASKAERLLGYEEALRGLELRLAQAEYDRLTSRQQELNEALRRIRDEVAATQAKLSHEEADLEAQRTALVGREQTLSGCQQRLQAHLETTRRLEADLRLEQERHDAAQRGFERTQREQAEAEARRVDLEAQAVHLGEALGEAEPMVARTEVVRAAAQADRDAARATAEALHDALRDLRRQENQATEERAEHRRRLDRLTNRLELLEQEQSRGQSHLVQLAPQLDEQATQVDEARRRRQAAERGADEARRRLGAAEAEHTAGQLVLDGATGVLQQLERERAATEAQLRLLESLVVSYEDFSDSVQFLAETPAWSNEVLRTVADVLSCDDAARQALDAALGIFGGSIVVDTLEEAERGMVLLREQKRGQATFVVLDRLARMRSETNVLIPGAQPLRDLVRATEPRYEPLKHQLLRQCYLVANPREAQSKARRATPPARFFAPDGSWASATGIVHGGSPEVHESALTERLKRREQLAENQAALERLTIEAAAATRQVEEARIALDRLALEDRRIALSEAEHALSAARSMHERLVYEAEAVQGRSDEMTRRLDEVVREMDAVRMEMEALRSTVVKAEEHLEALREEREHAETTYRDAEEESRAVQEHFAETSLAAMEARNHRDTLQRDRDRTQQEIGALHARAEDRRLHLETLQQTLAGADAQMAVLRGRLDEVQGERDALDEAVSAAKTGLMEVKVAIDQVEGRLRQHRQEREQKIRDEHALDVRKTETQTRLEDLVASVRDDFGLDLEMEHAPILEGFDEQAARTEVQDLRQKIRNLGNVNALALEEYDTEKQRLDFLLDQQQDLETAEATLLETIDEINTTAATRFNTTYDAIRTNFYDLFGELFGQEASAHLELADPSDPLESPIEIMAKPRGKRPVSISQLSSGEKTLTAIALLFAIYLVKPSPFCILDEVDAPLDDANIDRYMRLLRRFSDNTQFILVTHNKRTMELADRLYGITMQEQGVSRLVGVRFDEALALAG